MARTTMMHVFALALAIGALGCGGMATRPPEPAPAREEPEGEEAEAATIVATDEPATSTQAEAARVEEAPTDPVAVPHSPRPLPGRGGALEGLNAELTAFVRSALVPGASDADAAVDWPRQALIAEATAISVGGPGARPAGERHGFPPRVPEGCEPGFQRGGGYEALAIPPPMDDLGPADARKVERAIDFLLEGQELFATCLYEVSDYDPATRELRTIVRPRPAYVVSIYHDASGYHVQAFAQLEGAQIGTYPQP
jgi:hypothetical protein